MAERPEVRTKARPRTPSVEPGIIVVPYRSGRQSARLVPPIVLVLLGTAFLAYRAPNSRPARDLLTHRARSAGCPAARPRRVLIAASVPPPEPAGKAAEPPAARAEEVKQAGPAPTPEAVAEVDPRADIECEAEKTRERIAELDAQGTRGQGSSTSSAADRQRADRLTGGSRPRSRRTTPAARGESGTVAASVGRDACAGRWSRWPRSSASSSTGAAGGGGSPSPSCRYPRPGSRPTPAGSAARPPARSPGSGSNSEGAPAGPIATTSPRRPLPAPGVD